MLFKKKRYRVHNNYISGGPGLLASTIRPQTLNMIGLDFQFHIRWQHFQVGGYNSGVTSNRTSHLQGHLCYGYRYENTKYNFAVFGGPAYATGAAPVTFQKNNGVDTVVGVQYFDWGFYVNCQAVKKITFDIGLGAEVFAEVSRRQTIFGIKVIAFFSGSYRGPKQATNPNVRTYHSK